MRVQSFEGKETTDQVVRCIKGKDVIKKIHNEFFSPLCSHSSNQETQLSQLGIPGGCRCHSHLYLHSHRPTGQMPSGPALFGQLQTHAPEGGRRR